jgi:HK97 family phage major capsid protein
MPADVLDRLKETRTQHVAAMRAIYDGAADGKLTAEQEADWKAKDAEVRDLDANIERLTVQAEREARAAESRTATGDGGREERGAAGGSHAQVTSEPMIYGRGSGHSYFLDEARATLGIGEGPARGRAPRRDAEAAGAAQARG